MLKVVAVFSALGQLSRVSLGEEVPQYPKSAGVGGTIASRLVRSEPRDKNSPIVAGALDVVEARRHGDIDDDTDCGHPNEASSFCDNILSGQSGKGCADDAIDCTMDVVSDKWQCISLCQTNAECNSAVIHPATQPQNGGCQLCKTDGTATTDQQGSTLYSKACLTTLQADIMPTQKHPALLQQAQAAWGADLTGSGPKVDLGWKPCEWQKPTHDETMHCSDGTYCNPQSDQWTCCATHGGRLQCPSHLPKMCNQMDCAGEDYCCAASCELFDGEKPCHIEHQIYGMETGWLAFSTRDGEGDPIEEWTDLVSGPMTWELWYSKRPQADDNTNQGNAIMSTYADNHNTNAFSTSNRRRNIGVYIQPDTGRISLGAFVGDDSKTDPDPADPLAGANTMLGPAITDEKWHHIAVVWNRTEGRGWLYLDGKRHNEAVKYEPGNDNPGLDGKLVVGGGHLGRTSTCKVSQLRLWKVALHARDIESIVQCGEPDLPITELKGFYRLSGDFENSASASGFLSLAAEQGQGVFAEGNPCARPAH